MMTKTTWNRSFFDSLSTESAYVLGFLYADGYIVINPRGSAYFCFCSTDYEIIEKIRNALASNHTIGVRRRAHKTPGWKDLYVLQIGSKHAVRQLANLGIVQNKSLSLTFPKNLQNDLLADFVRGYFDGDGGVYFTTYQRAGHHKLTQLFQIRFTSGSESFLLDLHSELQPFVHGGQLRRKTNRSGYDLIFSTRDSLALSNLMYHNMKTHLYLSRKYEIVQKARTYYGLVV